MPERSAVLAAGAALAAALGLCCGLPILWSLGVVGAIAGWSLESWFLLGIGLTLAALGGARHLGGRADKSAQEAAHEADV